MGFLVPVFIGLVIVIGLIKKVKIFDEFAYGAKQGLMTIYSIAPSLIGLVVAVSMLKASGFFDVINNLLSPLCKALKFPPEILPFAFLRPVSGGGSTAILSSILEQFGADSIIGRIVSVMAGSTETTFYAVTVYYGSVGVTNIRHTMIAGLIADFAAVLFAVVSVNLYFSFF